MRFRAVGLLAGLAVAAGCGSGTSTSPTAPFTTTTQLVVNSLTAGSSSTYTFGVSAQSIVAVTFASAVANATGVPIDGTLEIGLGTPSGTTCAPTTLRTVSPQLAAQLIVPVSAGNYCIRVRDTGAVTQPTTFAARITVTSTDPPTTANTVLDSFSSAIPISGASSHTFIVPRGGNATVTLNSTGGGDKVMRLGLGLWDGTACRITQVADVAAGSEPQLISGVDAGTYCVTLRDVNATGRTDFSIAIQRPN